MHTARTLVLLIGSSVLAACGASSPPAETVTETETAAVAVTETETDDTAARPPTLALHEWGLVDVDLATGLAELSAGPGQPARPVVARKPVIYAHLGEAEHAALDLRVRVPGGSILEHWPLGALGADSIAWHAQVLRGPCGPGQPARPQPPCATADGYCETHELHRYATADSDCITTGAGPAALLFYRAQVPASALPLAFVRAADLRVRVTGPARPVLRISTALTGPWPAGQRVIARGEDELPVGTEAVDATAERAAMEGALRGQGLTPDEARVFLDAWSAELFGAGAPAARDAQRASRRWQQQASQDVILYWLTPAEIERIAPLEASIPVTTRRAWLVRVTLPAVATAGPAAP